MQQFRIAILGAGVIGREHAALLKAHPRTELVALVDITEAGRDFARTQNCAYYTDRIEMLETERPDGVIIALPNQLHVAASLECIERGIPVLLEKPVADTLAAAQVLVERVEALGVPVLIGHHRRHSPDIRAAKQAIAQGRLGDLVAVNGLWLVRKHAAYFDAQWRRESGGGPLLINLIHDIDCLRHLCGEIRSVQALASNRARGFAVEDTAGVLLQFENGAVGSFIASDSVPSPYAWDVASGQALYQPRHPENCYFIGGRNGTLAVPSLTLWQYEQVDGDWRQPLVRHQLQPELSRCYEDQLSHFLSCIEGLESPRVSAREGLLTLAATLAVVASAQDGGRVEVASLLPG